VRDPVELLRVLAEWPAAPFHEAYVARQIYALTQEIGLRCEPDRFGNMIAWYRGRPAPPAAPSGALAFNAHMDHPAFEVTGTAPLRGRLLGSARTPRDYFARRVPVRFLWDGGEASGAITGHFDDAGALGLHLEAPADVPGNAWGVFDVGGFREDGPFLHLPAADDLAGCAAALAALARCAALRLPVDVAAVFTRAEEVGLVGATLVARQGLLPPDTIVVSLEASRALPGGEQGAGPVIRVGDLATAFHPDGERVLRRAGALLTSRNPAATVQRQLMSGGTCEATAYQVFGYRTTGVAFPLGNYHNQGPDFTLAAEYIHRTDLERGVDLLCAAAEIMAQGNPPQDPVAARLESRADQDAERLATSAAGWTFLAAG
jgi:endoglucanase